MKTIKMNFKPGFWRFKFIDGTTKKDLSIETYEELTDKTELSFVVPSGNIIFCYQQLNSLSEADLKLRWNDFDHL